MIAPIRPHGLPPGLDALRLRQLHACESLIRTCLATVGHMLKIIQSDRLFLRDADSFEKYLAEAWNITPAEAEAMIRDAEELTALNAEDAAP